MDRVSGAGEPPLEAGERVCVESVEGASIYVKRIGGEPDWRPKVTTQTRKVKIQEQIAGAQEPVLFLQPAPVCQLLRFGVGFVSVVECLVFFEWWEFDRDPVARGRFEIVAGEAGQHDGNIILTAAVISLVDQRIARLRKIAFAVRERSSEYLQRAIFLTIRHCKATRDHPAADESCQSPA